MIETRPVQKSNEIIYFQVFLKNKAFLKIHLKSLGTTFHYFKSNLLMSEKFE